MEMVCNFIEKAGKAFDRSIYKPITHGVTYFYEKNKILCTLIRNVMFDYRIDIKIYGYYMKTKKAHGNGLRQLNF